MAYFELGAIRAFSSSSNPTTSVPALAPGATVSSGGDTGSVPGQTGAGASKTAGGANPGSTNGANTSGNNSGSGSGNSPSAATMLTPMFVTPAAAALALLSWMLL